MFFIKMHRTIDTKHLNCKRTMYDFSPNDMLNFGEDQTFLSSSCDDSIHNNLHTSVSSNRHQKSRCIRSVGKPPRSQRTPMKSQDDEGPETNEDMVYRVEYNPSKQYHDGRYDRSRDGEEKTTMEAKFRQASTPGGNPYNLLHKYSTSSDEYADSYYDSGTPRNLSPTSY